MCDYFYRSSIHEVLPELAKRNVAAIGMKSLGGGNVAGGRANRVGRRGDAEECIRFSLAQPIASLVVGVDSMKVLEQDIAVARRLQAAAGATRRRRCSTRVRPFAGDGRFEWSKSTQNFDGPYHRRQHGFDV